MSCMAEADFFSLLQEDEDTLYDVKFQFVDSHETVSGHKLLLSIMSPVFRQQFYRTHGVFYDDIEVILEEEFSYASFNMFIRHIYGDKKVIKTCSSFDLLFEILKIAKHYHISKLEKIVKDIIEGLKVVKDRIIPALRASFQYKDLRGFGPLAQKIIVKVKYLASTMSKKSLGIVYSENEAAYPELVQFLRENVVMEKVKTPVLAGMCRNCRMPKPQCKHGRVVDALPSVGLKFNSDKMKRVRVVKSVKRTSDGSTKVNIKFGANLQHTYAWYYPNDFHHFLYCCRS